MQPDMESLRQAVAEHPFPDYQDWWPLGQRFVGFMSDAIVPEWAALPGNDGALERVETHCEAYVRLVYGRAPRPGLVGAFVDPSRHVPIASGEFDALSYAFFRAAFERLADTPPRGRTSAGSASREFTKRVGTRFFESLASHLDLSLPAALDSDPQFRQLKASIDEVGTFLRDQGYLRTHFRFRFDLDIEHGGHPIHQREGGVVDSLQAQGRAYALYEMGYPVILPSAVYLYNTMGEAQHHSSRTIEELFERIGYEARETDDFDPGTFASDHVVELWVIRRKR